MPLIKFKPFLAVLAALTLISAAGGATVYYMHLSVLRSLSSPLSLGESLDMIEYLEYRIVIGGEEYTVKIYNDPESRSGTAELYRSGQLLYTVNYSYGENTLISLEMVKDGEVTTLDPVEYEERFLTSLSLTSGPAGELSAEPFPGIAPLQGVFYITRAMGVNWDSFIRGTGPGVPVTINVDFVGVETPLGSSRGIHVSIVPQNPALAISVWMKGIFSFELARIDGLLIAPRMAYDVVLAGGEGGIGFEVTDIKLSQS